MRLPRWWRQHFLGVEMGLAVALGVTIGIWSLTEAGESALASVLAGNRSTLYAVLSSVWGALLGFVITTMSIVLVSTNAPRMSIVRQSKHYPDLWRTFVSTIRALGLATAASITALLVDRDPPLGDPEHAAFVVAAYFAILAGLRLARSAWILENVVRLVGKEDSHSG